MRAFLVFLLVVIFNPSAQAFNLYFDRSFSDDGMHFFDMTGGGDDVVKAVAVDSLDRVIVASETVGGFNDDIYLSRFLSTGELDVTFGDGGFVTLDFYNDESVNDITTDSLNRIIIGGYAVPSGSGSAARDFLVARVLSNGALDPSFNAVGYDTLDFLGFQDEVKTVKYVSASNKILVAGMAYTVSGLAESDLAFARFDNDGSLDANFDAGKIPGMLNFDYDGTYGGLDIVQGIDIDPSNGNIIAIADVGDTAFPVSAIGIVKLRPRGGFQTAFSADGRVSHLHIDGFGLERVTHAQDIKFDSSGDVFAFGYGNAECSGGAETQARVLLIKYDGTTGALDTSFDSDGVLEVTCSGTPSAGFEVHDLLIDSSDDMWISYTKNSLDGDFFEQALIDSAANVLVRQGGYELDLLFLELTGGYNNHVAGVDLDSFENPVMAGTIDSYIVTGTDDTFITRFGVSECGDSVIEGDEDCDDGNTLDGDGCSGICKDESCTGTGGRTVYYADDDGDSYGDATDFIKVCSGSEPAGYIVSEHTDCNDGDATAYPGATEVCDGVDNDCDGLIDEGLTTTFYQDSDGDGYGDATSTVEACSAPAGYVSDNTDCDDSDGGVHTDITYYLDGDGDGYGDVVTGDFCSSSAPAGYSAFNTDCNDSNASINPGATEVCDGNDNNCDGSTDEGVTTTYYLDSDSDSYGFAGISVENCSLPAGYAVASGDCNDGDPSINPGVTEICDGVDNNCDGAIDEGVTTTYYRDSDSDGYGDAGTTTEDCSAPSGYVSDNTDCNDTINSINPGATEICDGVDNDCDGSIDEGVTTTYYRDSDGDSYGNAAVSTDACSAPGGFVADNTDCNDGDALINPSATEVCDGTDNNCDGSTDEGMTTTYYRDSDGDSYGNAAMSTDACSAPAGYVLDNTDCDDSSASINPSISEDAALCGNGVDENCDGADLSCAAADVDGDGYSEIDGDCDDTNASINPGESESCDGVDNDCDGSIDEADAIDTETFYQDSDGDGYGNISVTTAACSVPSGYVSNSTDCDDTSSAIHPAGSEICGDGIDQNCDGGDLSCSDVDSDGDGFTDTDGDCDDTNSLIYPGATESCDGVDNDCDGSIDEADATDAVTFYQDSDGDGYGDLSSTTTACSAPAGYVSDSTDCDDSAALVYPAAGETCGDGIDQNCDGSDLACSGIDSDGDGFSLIDGDCDDGEAAINPGAEEICDSIDNDCDGTVDEGDVCVDSSAVVCGDGVVESAEECDDGNVVDGDGCSANCLTEIVVTPGEGDDPVDGGTDTPTGSDDDPTDGGTDTPTGSEASGGCSLVTHVSAQSPQNLSGFLWIMAFGLLIGFKQRRTSSQ